jgi:hypothetical protein
MSPATQAGTALVLIVDWQERVEEKEDALAVVC